MLRRHLPLVFQTLSALDDGGGDDSDSRRNRLAELRDHLLQLGKAESRLAVFREHNGAGVQPNRDAVNGVPSKASAPLPTDSREEVVRVLKVREQFR